MKLSDLQIYNVQEGRFQAAELYQGISGVHLELWRRSWRRLLRNSMNQEDGHWDWRALAKEADLDANLQSYTLFGDGAIQGLMIIELERFARLGNSAGDKLVYVSRIATAPWNRQTFTNSPRFAGIGTILLYIAVNRSLESGLGGRIGLHSLESAVSFYESKGMLNLGNDPDYEDLPYFEFTGSLALKFIGKHS